MLGRDRFSTPAVEPVGSRTHDTPGPRTYVVVCRGPHCRERGSRPLRERLQALLRGREDVRLVGYNCFGACEQGPNVVFFPEGEWFGALTEPSAAERVVRHATSGAPLDATHLELAEEERRGHLRNIAELIETLERDRVTRRRRAWWWPF